MAGGGGLDGTDMLSLIKIGGRDDLPVVRGRAAARPYQFHFAFEI
jgi:hypothetical protein